MDDLSLVQAANARKEALGDSQSRPNLAVSFRKDSETCSIVELPSHAGNLEREDSSSAMGAEDSDVRDDSEAVLLQADMKKSQMQILFPSVYMFFSSYRSGNPEKRVTPFALVLLFALFVVYVLNQADRLVLAVTIPAGLRCELKASECGANESINVTTMLTFDSSEVSNANELTIHNFVDELNSNLTNKSPDCIHFSDSEQGLLTGPAFTLIYVVAGLPLARLADTRSRPLVLIVGIVFWSLMVLLTGFAVTFWQLVLLRIMLGVGEAACNPVAYSLIADFFPSFHRASALAFYHYGVYVGGALGWMSGVVNLVLSWRWTFHILGIAGLLMTPVTMMAVYEPKAVRTKRRERMKGKSTYTILEVILFLVKSPPYWMLLVAGSIRNISGYALGAWMPTFFVREYGITANEFAIPVGLAVLLGGGVGCFLGGFISDRLSERWKNSKAFVISVSQVLAAPAIAGVLLAPNYKLSFGLVALAYITAETWLGPAAAIVQDICMPAMRAQASAIYVGVITIVASIGPVLVPALIDHITEFDNQRCEKGVGYALLVIVPTFYILSSILFAVLGIIIHYWDKRQSSQAVYTVVRPEVGKEAL